MDPESSEVLNNLVMRWRARTEQWQQISHAQSDLDKLEADIEKLTRHVEGLRGIHNTLQTLETYRTSLIQLSALAKKAHDETLGKQTQPALDAPHEPLQNMTREEDTGLAKLDSDLAAIDEEMRQLHCHHEDFVLKYMQVKADYRTPPQAMPLPYGFRCHKQYIFEVDMLKTRIRHATMQAEAHRETLRAAQHPASAQTDIDFCKVTTDLNQCIATQQSLQVSLYFMLTHLQPIDAAAFHTRCSALIDRRVACLEAKRMLQISRLVSSSAPAQD